VLLRLLWRYPHPAALARNAPGTQLFPVLRRLECAGLVTRRRGLYRLTARGKRELALELELGRAVARGLFRAA
jgi:DNA-binding PadR family transcriptional regulator